MYTDKTKIHPQVNLATAVMWDGTRGNILSLLLFLFFVMMSVFDSLAAYDDDNVFIYRFYLQCFYLHTPVRRKYNHHYHYCTTAEMINPVFVYFLFFLFQMSYNGFCVYPISQPTVLFPAGVTATRPAIEQRTANGEKRFSMAVNERHPSWNNTTGRDRTDGDCVKLISKERQPI